MPKVHVEYDQARRVVTNPNAMIRHITGILSAGLLVQIRKQQSVTFVVFNDVHETRCAQERSSPAIPENEFGQFLHAQRRSQLWADRLSRHQKRS